MKKTDYIIKRAFDILFSIVIFILILPLFVFISLTIYFSSGVPILFHQERLGKNGKVFTILKFRTMVINAEHIGKGLKIEGSDDPRITSIGKVLRRTSLDEIPQILNVIKGDMSLVGPRPPVTYFPYKSYQDYPEWEKKRFSMKPGITGLAQVHVRNSVAWSERIKIDIQYIENFSLFLDLKILFKTINKVFNNKDVY